VCFIAANDVVSAQNCFSLLEAGGQRYYPAALLPGKRPGTRCVGGRVGPRSDLDGCGISRPRRDLIPGPSSLQRVAILTALSKLKMVLVLWKTIV